jgi:hypothetical protein
MTRTIPLFALAAMAFAAVSSLTEARAPVAGLTATQTGASDVFAARQGFSFDLGSKTAVGYFLGAETGCAVTLMVAERVDLDREAPRSAARLTVSLASRQSTEIESEEARVTLTCSATGDRLSAAQTRKASAPAG